MAIPILSPTNTTAQSEALEGFKKTGYDNSHLLLAGGGAIPVSDFAPATAVETYKTTVTDDSILNHGLNTYDVICEFYDTSTLYTVGARVKRITTNEVSVEFDTPPINPIKVLIRKV